MNYEVRPVNIRHFVRLAQNLKIGLPLHSFGLIFPVWLIPGFLPIRKNCRMLGDKPGEDASREICRVFDLVLKIHIARGRIRRSRGPFGRSDRENETGGDEERWSHLRPIGTIFVAADVESHVRLSHRIIGEETANHRDAGLDDLP